MKGVIIYISISGKWLGYSLTIAIDIDTKLKRLYQSRDNIDRGKEVVIMKIDRKRLKD